MCVNITLVGGDQRTPHKQTATGTPARLTPKRCDPATATGCVHHRKAGIHTQGQADGTGYDRPGWRKPSSYLYCYYNCSGPCGGRHVCSQAENMPPQPPAISSAPAARRNKPRLVSPLSMRNNNLKNKKHFLIYEYGSATFQILDRTRSKLHVAFRIASDLRRCGEGASIFPGVSSRSCWQWIAPAQVVHNTYLIRQLFPFYPVLRSLLPPIKWFKFTHINNNSPICQGT